MGENQNFLILLTEPINSRIAETAVSKQMGTVNYKRFIFSLTSWHGPKKINNVAVQEIFGGGYKRLFKSIVNFSLHSENEALGRRDASIQISWRMLDQFLSRMKDEIVLVTDDSKIAEIFASNYLASHYHHIKKVSILVVTQFNNTILSSEFHTETNFQFNTKDLLIIQPDWTKSGSSKTFDLVGRLAEGSGFFPIRITTSLGTSKPTSNLGYTFSNSKDEAYFGLSLSANLSYFKSKLFLFIGVFKQLFSMQRNSVVLFKYNIYSAVRLRRQDLKLIQHANIKAIYVNHYFNLPLAFRIQNKLQNGHEIKIILDSHDLQYKNFEEQNYKVPWTRYFRSNINEKQIELELISKVDRIIFVSKIERDEYVLWQQENNRGTQNTNVAIPFEVIRINESSISTKDTDTITLGIFMADNQANRASLVWFFKNIVPEIEYLPLSIRIFGGIKSAEELFPKSDRVKFLGRVESLEIAYSSIDICVLPVIVGNGVAIKTLEAIAFGKPFVGTKLAGRGLPESAGSFFCEDTHDFVTEVTRLVKSSSVREQRAKELIELADELSKSSYIKNFSSWFSDIIPSK